MIPKRLQCFFVKSNKAPIELTQGRRKNVGQSGFREPLSIAAAPASCFASCLGAPFRKLRPYCEFSLFAQHRGCHEKYPLPKYRAFWPSTSVSTMTNEVAGIGETIRERVLLTDLLSRQRVAKRLFFVKFLTFPILCGKYFSLFVN